MSSIPASASAIDETTILAELGIAVPRQITCPTSAAMHGAIMATTELPGSRVVIKVTRPSIAHKTDVGGVRIVPNEIGDIAAAIGDLALRLDAAEVSVSEWIDHDSAPGGEMLLAIRWSSEFGPLVTFGAGGTAAEVMASVATLSPIMTGDPLAIVRRIPFTALVTGHRNQKARVSSLELRALLSRCLRFADSRLPQAGFDIEINPLVATPSGLYALDVLITPPEPTRSRAERPLEKIAALLHPLSVAIMGVSSTSINAGRIIARNLAAHARSNGREPRIAIIKEGPSDVDGIPCVARLEDLEPVDLLVLAIAADGIPSVVESVIAGRRAESMIIIPGGLGEHEGSEDLERRVAATIERSRATGWRGPVVNGGNCLGVRTSDVDTIFLPREKWTTDAPVDVPLAIVSQSGALAVSMVTRLAPLMPRYIVSIGNQLDLTAGDYLRYFEQSHDVDVFAFYVEGFVRGDGRSFFEAATRLRAAGKDVILYRAGRTPAGRRATASHTAVLAGDASIARELASAAGVAFAETLDEFLDLVRSAILLRDRKPRGLRLGAVSNAGFEAVAFADNYLPLELSPLGQSTRDAIESILRDERLDRIVTVANPLDVNPLLDDAAFATIAKLVLEDGAVDVGVIGCVPLSGALQTLQPAMDEVTSVVSRLIALREAVEKPWVAVVDAGARYDAMARRLESARIPVFRTADRAVRVLAKWTALNARSA